MRILLCVDDSKPSYDAAAFAQRLLDPDDEVIVLNVARANQVGLYTAGGLAGAPAPATAETSWDILRENAWRVVQDAGSQADADEGRVELGDPGQRICDVAAEEGVEMIIMGSRDRGLMERIFSPSVSSYVVRHAPCPVLVVR
jgi:nucleotide-binding universal stress UspA family protein